jgi:hypothetical protein
MLLVAVFEEVPSLSICTFAHLHALCPHSIFVVSQRVGLHAFVLQV